MRDVTYSLVNPGKFRKSAHDSGKACARGGMARVAVHHSLTGGERSLDDRFQATLAVSHVVEVALKLFAAVAADRTPASGAILLFEQVAAML